MEMQPVPLTPTKGRDVTVTKGGGYRGNVIHGNGLGRLCMTSSLFGKGINAGRENENSQQKKCPIECLNALSFLGT
jgi:hypothetical protein